MKIILSAVEGPLADAWQEHCGDISNVFIHRGSILDLEVDAIVSPANSFGFMDGGIDHAYSQYFGWHVQERLQKLIREKHHGELLVGAAEVVETDDKQIPFLIAAPTMRVPMVLENTVHPYLAARAVLLLVKYGGFSIGTLEGVSLSSKISSVAFSGLGTGIGRVGFHTCAHQVRAAIEHIVLENNDFPATWADASIRHQKLYTEYTRNLQHPE